MKRRDFLISSTALPLLYIGCAEKEPDNTINIQPASGVSPSGLSPSGVPVCPLPHGSGDLVYVRYAPSYGSYAQGKN